MPIRLVSPAFIIIQRCILLTVERAPIMSKNKYVYFKTLTNVNAAEKGTDCTVKVLLNLRRTDTILN